MAKDIDGNVISFKERNTNETGGSDAQSEESTASLEDYIAKNADDILLGLIIEGDNDFVQRKRSRVISMDGDVPPLRYDEFVKSVKEEKRMVVDTVDWAVRTSGMSPDGGAIVNPGSQNVISRIGVSENLFVLNRKLQRRLAFLLAFSDDIVFASGAVDSQYILTISATIKAAIKEDDADE